MLFICTYETTNCLVTKTVQIKYLTMMERCNNVKIKVQHKFQVKVFSVLPLVCGNSLENQEKE